ncbi:MAG: DUF1540 domain-containing protein [Polyangiaceae bacterium]|nr:DUF1540 domain-containing protein [Polyangiaceae bacterium]
MRTVHMPMVSECSVHHCVYNTSGNCHAHAITVGDGVHPACDTFLRSREHVPEAEPIAGVGACKVASCEHNRLYECNARAIRVGLHQGHADCLTFARH